MFVPGVKPINETRPMYKSCVYSKTMNSNRISRHTLHLSNISYKNRVHKIDRTNLWRSKYKKIQNQSINRASLESRK